MSLSQPKRVAIVGGGFSGISSFWALQNSAHDVHLFEASPTLGGHIKTLPFENNGNQVKVNTELPLFNPEACPNLLALLSYLGISTSAIPFSFGVSDGVNTLKWYSSILKSVLLRPQLLCSREALRILLDAICLRYLAAGVPIDEPHISGSDDAQELSLTHTYLPEEGYSDSFRDKYLAPLLSMLWRTNAGRFLPRFPVRALVRCLSDHRLSYSCKTMPKWMRIDTGVKYVVETMTRDFPSEKVHLEAKVNAITRASKDQYGLITSDGRELLFDHIIFTVDGHEIMRILGSTAGVDEQKVLQYLGFTRNIAVLHSDNLPTSEMRRPLACNYIIAPNSPSQQGLSPPKSCLRYNINVLQDIPTSLSGRVFITFNPLEPLHPSLVQGIWEFTEPEPSVSSLCGQALLPSIQNKHGLSYGFCWTGRGLLEDALTSGLRMAVEGLGAQVPFKVEFHRHPLDSTESPAQTVRVRDILIRTVLHAIRVFVLVLEIFLILIGRLHTPGSKTRARMIFSRAINTA